MDESLGSHESAWQIRYPEGWREILEAPDAEDYRTWLRELADLTQRRLTETGDPLAVNIGEISRRWQEAVELVADASIDLEDHLTEAQTVETALLTLQTNIEIIGWDEEGLAFTVPNLFTGEDAAVDLRTLPGSFPSQ